LKNKWAGNTELERKRGLRVRQTRQREQVCRRDGESENERERSRAREETTGENMIVARAVIDEKEESDSLLESINKI